MTRQYTCEQCGRLFDKHWNGTTVRRFCGVTCRNRYLLSLQWSRVPERKAKVCPNCGHIGYRTLDICLKCGGVTKPCKPVGQRRSTPRIWTPERLDYLRSHYAADGAGKVAQHVGLTPGQVRNKAMALGLRLSAATTRLIVHEAARAHMTAHNPMLSDEAKAKVQQWRKTHPEEAEAVYAKLRAGQQRIEREKPSKLEQHLRELLAELGIDFEPAALIKDKFIVDVRIGSLIIQADGDYWHGHPRFAHLTERQAAQQRRDRAQDAYLRTCGYTVVRIWESEMSRDKVHAILQEHRLITGS